jgi:hypothetical protein
MIALLCLVLAVLASPFKSKSRLEAENAALRHQLIVLRRISAARQAHDQCACRKSYPHIFVVQSTEMRLRENPADRLNDARNRRVLAQR